MDADDSKDYKRGITETEDTHHPALFGAIEVTGVTPANIQKAANRISPYIHHTAVLTSTQADLWLSGEKCATRFYFKGEALQKTGSFKFRGACNALSILSETGDLRPVVAHSSGNHAQALACAARLFNRPAWLVVPDAASAVKLDALYGYGANVVRCGNTLADREQVAERVLAQVDGVFVHPYLNENVVCGQGTLGLEFAKQVPFLEALIVPIGGGGMISGVSIAVKSINPSIRIFGAEPDNANAAARSIAAGARVQMTGIINTVADGLKASIGALGWEVVSRLVDEVISVSEEDTINATKFVWQRMKTVIEPSAGVGVAAARSERFRRLGFKHVGVILCGGNIDIEKLPWNS